MARSWYLTTDHQLVGRIKDIKVESELRHHLVMYHSISVKGMNKGELGKAHLLAHAIQTYPELKILMEIPEEWGGTGWDHS